jgi:hypothetical protein
MFGSLIEQAMKAAQGGGEGGQPPAGAPPAGVGPAGAPPAPAPPGRDPLEQRVERLEERAEQQDRGYEQQSPQPEERTPLLRADDGGLASGPEGGHGAAPVAPEQPNRGVDDDLRRRL